MGSNFLYDWGGINQAFAAGKIGMYMGGSDVYTSLVQQNHIKPADYGLAALPLDSSSSDAGILGGGSLAVVSAKASKAQQAAAVKWVDFYYMRKLTTQDAAVLDAKTLAEGKQPVGVAGPADLRQGDAGSVQRVDQVLRQCAARPDDLVHHRCLRPEPDRRAGSADPGPVRSAGSGGPGRADQ